jgi:hypothetical protein
MINQMALAFRMMPIPRAFWSLRFQKKGYPCEKCKEVFPNYEALKQHKKDFHAY